MSLALVVGQRVQIAMFIAMVCFGMPRLCSAIEIYKWVDESGVTHYSNEKPRDVQSNVIPAVGLSVIPGDRIGKEAARAARAERQPSEHPVWIVEVPYVDQQALSERRDRMLHDCHANNGTDCEREVDTELRAECLQGCAPRHLVPPPKGFAPIPTPTPSPNPPGVRLR
jgi:hypothetical protein